MQHAAQTPFHLSWRLNAEVTHSTRACFHTFTSKFCLFPEHAPCHGMLSIAQILQEIGWQRTSRAGPSSRNGSLCQLSPQTVPGPASEIFRQWCPAPQRCKDTLSRMLVATWRILFEDWNCSESRVKCLALAAACQRRPSPFPTWLASLCCFPQVTT